MKIEQEAGGVRLTVWTDGHPHWFDLAITQPNGEVASTRCKVADMHDLRYCIERVMSQLGDPKA